MERKEGRKDGRKETGIDGYLIGEEEHVYLVASIFFIACIVRNTCCIICYLHTHTYNLQLKKYEIILTFIIIYVVVFYSFLFCFVQNKFTDPTKLILRCTNGLKPIV
jgi:hypothetical protein